MPNKPGRYGIRCNAIRYLGKEWDAPVANLGAQVIKNLVDPIKGNNCTVICDRYFTSDNLF